MKEKEELVKKLKALTSKKEKAIREQQYAYLVTLADEIQKYTKRLEELVNK